MLLLLATPVAAAPERLAPGVISRDGQITLTPGFSPDGQTAYFARSDCADIGACPQRMMVARRTSGAWKRSEPLKLIGDGQAANGTPARVDFPSVTPDGRSLLFSWSVARADREGLAINEDFDLYRLDLTDPDAAPVPLDLADINRPRAGAIAKKLYFHNENTPVLTRPGDLYFWTERADGIGSRDVYVAPGDGKGGFKIARPMPAPVNGTGLDTMGHVSEDGMVMLLAYPDRGGQGGSDIFVSRKVDGRWSPPLNLGPAVNSSADDFGATITPDGQDLVFSSTRAFPSQKVGLIQVWTVPVSAVPALRR
jgi:Tol biopolymer transport system component